MQIWRERDEIDLSPSVVTIGIFDGVHRGHQQIIKRLVATAKQRSQRAVVMTFSPHPSVLHAPQPVKLIQSLADRLDTLETLGVDACWLVEYNWDLARLSPEDFIKNYFVDALQASAVIVGKDVRFGTNNTGDLHTLQDLGDRYGFEVEALDDILDPQESLRFSSTRIRELLSAGKMEQVRELLGRDYRVRGEVVKGFQRGRLLGFPTANLGHCEDLVVPAHGVYAGLLVRSVDTGEGDLKAVEHLPAAISVGDNPHFSGTKTTIEAHVLGRGDLDLYGQNVAVDFRKCLRPMLKMNSLDELLAQMDKDILETAAVLGVPAAGRIDPAVVTADC